MAPELSLFIILKLSILFEKLKARLLADLKVKAEYDALVPAFEIAAQLLRARLRAGLSQAELAERMGTSQSTIARLENGHTLQTWSRSSEQNLRADKSSVCRG